MGTLSVRNIPRICGPWRSLPTLHGTDVSHPRRAVTQAPPSTELSIVGDALDPRDQVTYTDSGWPEIFPGDAAGVVKIGDRTSSMYHTDAVLCCFGTTDPTNVASSQGSSCASRRIPVRPSVTYSLVPASFSFCNTPSKQSITAIFNSRADITEILRIKCRRGFGFAGDKQM